MKLAFFYFELEIIIFTDYPKNDMAYFSGATAAWSFKQIKPEKVKKVFILGPSHHVYLPNCALPVVDKYETPLGNLLLNKQILAELKVCPFSIKK